MRRSLLITAIFVVAYFGLFGFAQAAEPKKYIWFIIDSTTHQVNFLNDRSIEQPMLNSGVVTASTVQTTSPTTVYSAVVPAGTVFSELRFSDWGVPMLMAKIDTCSAVVSAHRYDPTHRYESSGLSGMLYLADVTGDTCVPAKK